MKKAMISQPMNGILDEEIQATRERAITHLKTEGYSLVNTFFTDESFSEIAMAACGIEQIPIYFLAKALEKMAQCQAVFFCQGWEAARGCVIEHAVAEAYGLEIMYE